MQIPPSWLNEISFRIDAENLPIRAEQIRSRLRSFPIMVGSQSLIEPLLVVLLWGHVSRGGLLVWLGVLLLLHFAEMGLWWKYRSFAHTLEQCRAWSLAFKVSAVAVAAMWAVAAIGFFPAELAYQAWFICVILGVAAGAVTMNPLYPPALYLFLSIMLLPTVFRIAYANDPLHWVVAAMLAVFFVVVIHSGRQLSRTFLVSLRQRDENLSLVGQLTREKSRAESASREKSRFLATASHDLRQPLQALMLFSDALQEQALEKKMQHLAGQIGKSVNALVEMFDELLDVARLEAGVVEVRWQNFELQPLLDRLYVDLAPLAQSKGLGFDMPSGEGVVYSDPFLLSRILRNLISNAIRYTEQGKVSIRCIADADGFRFVVADTGIGISPEMLPHIFEEYYQVDNQHRDRRNGLGLGLAIVRRVEDLLGCKVKVRSEPGQGSEFSFEVQQGKMEQHVVQPFVITHSRHDLRGVRVALVEDDPDIREQIAGLMRGWGCMVFEGEHGDEVLRKLDVARRPPDLLVCDYRLPQGLTAIHVVQRMRELWGAGIPALVVTGDTAAEVLQDIHASGAILLHKPIAPAHLRAMIYFALHGEG